MTHAQHAVDRSAGTRRTAWLFPGHGSQYRGMGRGFPFERPCVRDVFDEAESISGLALRRASEHADAATLRDPVLLEPLLVAYALACAALLDEQGRRPHAVIGYSAGVLPAMQCAGVFDRQAALTLAVRRGRALKAMAATCRGAMGSSVGLTAMQLCAALASVAPGVDIGGWNAPDHMTLAGESQAIDHAATAIRSAGGTWFPIEVEGAWHSTRAAEAAGHLASICDGIEFAEPGVAFYCSCSGLRESKPERLRNSMIEHVFRPVLWFAATSALRLVERIDDFVEVGCGRALQGMTRRGAGPAGREALPVRFHAVYDRRNVDVARRVRSSPAG